ncbi:MAG: hypothetical protein NTY19_05810, partial [Planctomycetota bacterium]|nr:hypothetical protein [Planctomycetota bacterium]
HVPAADFPHNREVMLAKERMKQVTNRNFALVTGIIACWLRRDDMSSRRSVMTTLKTRQLLMRRS